MPGGVQASGGKGTKLPLHIDDVITNTSFPGPVAIGSIGPKFVVNCVSVEVDVAFDGASSLTIGDDINGHASLMVAADTDLSTPGVYTILVNMTYTAQTQVKTYFMGSPTLGSAHIFVYYQ